MEEETCWGRNPGAFPEEAESHRKVYEGPSQRQSSHIKGQASDPLQEGTQHVLKTWDSSPMGQTNKETEIGVKPSLQGKLMETSGGRTLYKKCPKRLNPSASSSDHLQIRHKKSLEP